MKITYYQMDTIFKDIQTNIEKVVNSVENLETDLLILPELFNTGYLYSSKEDLLPYSENVPEGNTSKQLESLAKRKNMFIVGGIAELEKNSIYNTVVVIAPDGYIGKYRKIHLTKLEKNIFSSGKEIKVFEILGYKIGISICYDIWFPEHVRIMAKQEVQLICHPSNFGGKESLEFSRIRALENNIFVVTCNRVGIEKGINFDASFRGESQIVSPKGGILISSFDKEDISSLDLNLLESNDKSSVMTEDLRNEYNIYNITNVNLK